MVNLYFFHKRLKEKCRRGDKLSRRGEERDEKRREKQVIDCCCCWQCTDRGDESAKYTDRRRDGHLKGAEKKATIKRQEG